MSEIHTWLDVFVPAPGNYPGAGFWIVYTDALIKELESIRDDLGAPAAVGLRIFNGGNLPNSDLGRFLRFICHKMELNIVFKSIQIEPQQMNTAVLTTCRNFYFDRYEMDFGSLNILDFRRLDRPYDYVLHGMLTRLFGFFELHQVCPVLYADIPGQTEASLTDSINRALTMVPGKPDEILIRCPAGKLPENINRKLREEGYSYPEADEDAVWQEPRQYQRFARQIPGQQIMRQQPAKTEDPAQKPEIWGVGLGAKSLIDGYIMNNTCDEETYIRFAGNPEKTVVSIMPA